MNKSFKRAQTILGFLTPEATHLTNLQRFGSANDGGYIMLNDVSANDYLISMGVGDDINFEKDLCTKILGADLYDYTVAKLPAIIENSRFFPERIGSLGSTTLMSTVERVPIGAELLLKIDIEGSEWDALSIVDHETLNKFRQIVIEFHGLENILEDVFYEKALNVLKKLDETHFVLNVHPNNNSRVIFVENLLIPEVVEVSYLRRSSYGVKFTGSNVLATLNSPCNPSYPEIFLQSIENLDKLDLETFTVGHFSLKEKAILTNARDAIVAERDAIKNSRIWRYSRFYRDFRRVT